ncbi:uncharacterized protein LOC129242278 [Anastrepha obliqua]|uniref:uncharacterized protein LOC129242278 n=1 Tax=Anastrepha obliqua TaxID=95512 RepID=UPI0024099224|nr:uncharacterized protein LOC129242278 [Anastrepha obliqua]
MAELNSRASAIKAIKRIHDRVSGFQQGAFDEFHLQQELKSLSAHYARFVTNHELLVGNAANAELEAHEKLWEEVEGIYNNACTHLNRAIMGAKPSQSAVMSVRECEVKLEPLAIPTFDGTMQNWLAFKDVFELLVHNTDYPEAYKLGKLRQAVSASAVPLVGSVYSGGYADLWKALKERFDNRRQLAETHVSRSLNIKPTTEDTPTALLFIVDTVHESLRALHVMGLPVAEWDAVVVPIIVSKLPITTQREWNMSCSPTEIPSLDELLTFLGQRAHSLSTTVVTWSNGVEFTSKSHHRAGGPSRAVRSHVVSAEEGKCTYCQGAHRIMKCARFLVMKYEDRITAAKATKLCFNCLKQGHSARQCPSGNCRHCGRKHNSLLCRESLSKNPSESKCEVSVEGIGAYSYARTRGRVTLTLKSRYSSFSLEIVALVTQLITKVIPTVHIDMTRWQHLNGLELADTQFGIPSNIDILIGADVWGKAVEGDIRLGGLNEPHAQRTRFGWVVFGPVPAAQPATPPTLSFSTQQGEEDARLEELVRSFWKLEEVPSQDCNGEDECEKIFLTTHSRTREGRYMVHIPFHPDAPALGNSYAHALRQFHLLERRLAANCELKKKYIAFMREYADLGHMEPVSHIGDGGVNYYIPHHAVLEKFRVVFNASARTTSGLSLNDVQLVGAMIQEPLVNIIFRFWGFRVALTADIEKMFHQILITPEHRDFQRIIWRESPDTDLAVYRLTTVTYGMACSPYNAVRALNQCSYDNYNVVADGHQSIVACDAILSSFYVDDFLISCDTEDKAFELAVNVSAILSAGQFRLRKWSSNSGEVVKRLISNNSSIVELASEPSTATVLGLSWDPTTDEIFFKANLNQNIGCLTKRRVLSEVAKLFDPTGMLAPIVIAGKIFIQKLWSAGLEWDAPLPDALQNTWVLFYRELDVINRIRVPRWLGLAEGKTTMLLGFCDASSLSYAAVLYTRTTDGEGRSTVSLLTARTKVAPLKGATIPRLELCAAHLLASTLDSVRTALRLTDASYHLWSDSRIVLCWLRKPPTTLKPYISNRVRHIQELTSPDRWHYVRSAQNPADCASRGIRASELVEHQLWWQGPKWLMDKQLPIYFGIELKDDELDIVRGEQRVSSFVATTAHASILTTRRLDGQIIPLSERFSSLQKLLRTVAIVLRWLPVRRHLRRLIVNPTEMDDALNVLIRNEQYTFATDMSLIRKGSEISSSSKLRSLNPYIDCNDILRVRGRIGHADLPEDRRFPIILPKHGSLVHLLIRHAHETTLHGGAQITLQTLRARYWILNGRQAVRSFVQTCVICRRHRGVTLSQQMASLPRHRITAARPFISSGVDYCGPFTVRIGTKRSRTTIKTYLAVFVCMATKAVHIEVVDDLSSHAFLAAFTRFTSRRAPCRDLYSDNGTTFTGANRLLKEDLAAWQNDNNQQSLANLGTHWHFIAPSAPHQGGLWEAAVKSAKYHLVRLVGAQSLWYSQLQTLATRIEACLNSRPLTPIYDDPNDKLALTPADFMVGAPLVAVPEADIRTIPSNRIKHWLWLRQIHQQFWQRWSEEYLSTLQTRNKWQTKSRDVKIGDIVIVRHENLPPTYWRLGRVTAVHPGSNGLIRNVTLQTANGMMTRAVQKLCRLLDAEHFEASASTGQDVQNSSSLAPP